MEHNTEHKPSFGKKELPFKVPDGYFENLSNRILQNKDQKPALTIRLYLRVAAVASILIVISISVFYFLNQNPEEKIAYQMQGFNPIPDELLQVDESTIIEYLPSEPELDNSPASVEKDEIINYLVENNIDEDLIYEEITSEP